MKKIIIYGIFPPPNHGQSIGTQMVYSYLQKKQKVIKIDISPGSLNSGKIGYLFSYFSAYLNSLRKLREIKGKNNTLYFVPAVRPLSHFKDIILLILFNYKFDRIICHIRSGEFDNLFRNPLSKLSTKYLIKKSTSFVFLSQKLSDRCRKWIPQHKRKVIYNFIDKEISISKEDAVGIIEEKVNTDYFNFAFISNLIETKGYKILLDAFREVSKKKSRNIRLYLIGDGTAKTIHEITALTKKRKDILYLGKISDRKELKKIFEKIHVFVLPTYYKTEAQPRSIIEALNFGIPVISTIHASIPEIISHNYNGKLVPPKNIENLVQAMEDLLDKNKWKILAINARDSYDSNHDFNLLAEKLMDLMI
ncbi:MAG: glycosyltransferase family 4 protein [bacterium]